MQFFFFSDFDVLQMADHFREFRKSPPLIEHIGAKSVNNVQKPQKNYIRI